MTRAMQLAMSERQAHDLCAKEKVTISALESLRRRCPASLQ